MTVIGRWSPYSDVFLLMVFTAVEAACQEALDHGVCSASVIINILARSRDPAPATTLQIPDALRLAHEPVAGCARYDRLRRVS